MARRLSDAEREERRRAAVKAAVDKFPPLSEDQKLEIARVLTRSAAERRAAS